MMLAAHPDPSDYYLLAELEMIRGDYTAAMDWWMRWWMPKRKTQRSCAIW